MEPAPPEGFKPLFRTSPFLDHNGPFFYRENADGTFVVGLRIRPEHANARGGAHGGLLMTLCDIALGYRTTRSQTPSPMLTTASVTTDFAGGAKVGDWVEAHVDVHKVGGRLAFANCYLCATANASCTPAPSSRGAATGHSGAPLSARSSSR